MNENSENKKKSQIFEGRIKEFEAIIIQYHLEKANFSEQSDTLALIMAYLSIHVKLTQNQLKELTKFSISTISTSLSLLINTRYVNKEKISKSHEYLYFTAYDYNDSLDDVLGSLSTEIDFFKLKIKELINSNNKEKKGFKLLLNRITEALQLFELYNKILKTIQDPNTPYEIENYEDQKITVSEEELEIIVDGFDPEIKKIENAIIDFFLYHSVYSILKKFALIIDVFFITRKVLTQEEIRDLTGLSFGKVSEVLNKLIKINYIELLKKNELKDLLPEELKRKKIYILKSIKYSFMMKGVSSMREILKWETKFETIKSELENNQKLKTLRGYNEIYRSVNTFLNVVPIYKKAYNIFIKFIEK